MSNFNPADSGYVEVKDRIEAFYGKFPEGSIQTEIVMLNDNKVVVKAIAFRDREDPRPGVGHSQLAIPGKTSFTKDSELENAETSAVGRAIANLGFEVKRSVASADEIRAKAGNDDGASASRQADGGASGGAANGTQGGSDKPATTAQKNLIRARAREKGVSDEELKAIRLSTTGKQSSAQFTSADIDAMLQAIDTAAQIKSATDGGEVVA